MLDNWDRLFMLLTYNSFEIYDYLSDAETIISDSN